MNDEGALNDSVFDDSGPFSDTPDGDAVSLDQALREFGPAAIDDLIPRLRALAADLDEAHAAGFVHGRLHPSKILITEDATYLMGRRVPASATLTREADQYALATTAYEWMFGRPITGPAERPVDVRSIPGVDRAALSQAFTQALSRDPSRRFASCNDFVDAIAGSTIPSLPLMADDDPVGPFMPEEPEAVPIASPVPVADLSFTTEEPDVMAAEPEIDASDRILTADTAFAASGSQDAVPSWQPSSTAESVGERFSGYALIFAAIVGMAAGFAAGYMARPRALQSGPPQVTAGATGATGATGAPGAPGASSAPKTATKAPTKAPVAPVAPVAPGARDARDAPDAPAASKIGRLLVRSTPTGASVEVDGVARGVTPLALRDLDLGSRQVTVARRGYVQEERRIVLTKARPSRSLEVRLTAAAAAGRAGVTAPAGTSAPRPSTPATIGKPMVSTGGLAVESLPTGAAVTVNGKPSGTTPLTLNDLPPGDYRVTISMPGYRDFATTIRVVAGERARAAARLTEQEQE